jgi:hypothetical protein
MVFEDEDWGRGGRAGGVERVADVEAEAEAGRGEGGGEGGGGSKCMRS